VKVVCSYCEKFIREKPPLDDPTPTHAICADCFEHYAAQWDGQSMGEFLDRFDSPVLVSDRDGRTVAINAALAESRGISNRQVAGLLGGDLFECEHARLPLGCGRTVHCKGCSIRNVVTDTIDSGKPHVGVPATLDSRNQHELLSLSSFTRNGLVFLLIEPAPTTEAADRQPPG